MSNEKLVSLEEKIAYLQNMIDDLNMVVFRQGEKIEQLNTKLKETNEKLLSNSDTTSYTSQTNDDKPPHY
jgi:SlyX protein|tara:strand:- start:975 stop:1184 length:210 start_codon:yes stop_codon:yes gene_type:complete